MGKRKQQPNETGHQARPSGEGVSVPAATQPAAASRPLSWWWFCAIGILIGIIHLSHSEVFKKDFTGLDDVIYIYPLQQLSLSEYIPKWLLKPGALAFPVRDASFGLDITLSSWLGFQTATITSVLLFVAYLAPLFHVFRRALPPLGALLLLIIVGLHPIEVETIQWSISRKHLLVGLWLSVSVAVCLRMARSAAQITDYSSSRTKREGRMAGEATAAVTIYPHFLPEWTLLIMCYVLSTLSHPTGIFFPLWVATFLWRVKGVKKGGILVYLSCAGLTGIGWTKFISSLNSDYGSLADFSFGTFSPRVLFWENGVLGLGRVGWQFLVPITQSVHFQPQDPRNIIGFFLLVGVSSLLVYYGSRFRQGHRGNSAASIKTPVNQFPLRSLLVLVVCTSLPQLLFCIRRDDFAVADRLLFLPFPYLVAAVFSLPSIHALLFKGSKLLWIPEFWITHRSRIESLRTVVIRSVTTCGIGALVSFYSVVSYRATHLWDTTNKAVDHCAESADASRCWGYKIVEWREQGCHRLMPNSERLLPRLSQESLLAHRIGPFLIDGFDAIASCEASLTSAGVALRMAAIKSLQERGAPPTSLAFAEMLINMSAGNLKAAHEVVRERFVQHLPSNHDVTPTNLGRVVGALQVLCLVPDMRAQGCGDTIQKLWVRYGGNDIREPVVEAARNLAVSALRFAQVEVAVPGQSPQGLLSHQ